jgi:hypothetical protein
MGQPDRFEKSNRKILRASHAGSKRCFTLSKSQGVD